MSSGDFIALILARRDAIGKWRELIGPTRVYRTKVEAPNTIRGLYGLTDTRNSVHGSDSLENAIKEIEFIFTDFDYHQWLEVDEPYFREDKLTYDSELSIHIPCAHTL
jgi:nucleoside-diphosphate kinase